MSRSILALILAMPTVVPDASGQVRVRERIDEASFSSHATIFTVNAVLSGATAGLLRAVRGGSFVDGFAQGTLGGGLVYAGKGVAARHFDGAGMIGRQLAAVGSSVVRNASDGRPMLGELVLPLGLLPGRLVVTTQGGLHAQPVVDLISLAATSVGLMSERYTLDLATSLSSGTAVFREDREPIEITPIGPRVTISGASTVGATVFINQALLQSQTSLAHERVHVLQFDFLLATWGDRADTWVVGGASWDRFFKLNSMLGAFGWINQTMFFPQERHRLPWEVEARRLSGQAEQPTVLLGN